MIRKIARSAILKPGFWVFVVSFIFFIILGVLYSVYIDTASIPEARGYESFHYIYMFRFRPLSFWHFRHPLYVLFFKPYSWILAQLGISTKMFFIVTSALALSLSNWLIYKILLKEKLSISNAITVVILFSSFAHILLLSTQVETFVLTMLFSLLCIYLIQIKRDNTLSDNLLFALLTGVTSTNSIKFFLLNLCNAKSIKQYCAKCIKSIWLFILLFTIPLIGLYKRIVIEGLDLSTAILGDTFEYTTTEGNRLLMFINGFICDPICFHSQDVFYANTSGDLGAYNSWWCYIPVIFILCMVGYGIFFNYKNKVVQMALVCVLVDFFFTQVLGYGVDQPWIACGGWLFAIPIIYGVALHHVRNTNVKKILVGITIVIALCLFGHNLEAMYSSLMNGGV